MTKADLLSALTQQLESQIATMQSALSDSDESASGDETKSEGKYDTRAIEAAYLAEAQAEQLALAESALTTWKLFEPQDFNYDDAIGVGALVEVEQEGEICFYLLAPTAGGQMTQYLGCDVTVITPDSRLYQELCEEKMGYHIESMQLTVTGLE